MAVESATKISQLVATAPASSEPVSEGAGHLRAIKTAVQGSFPSFGTDTDSGIVTLTADEINELPAAVAAAAGGSSVPATLLRNQSLTLNGIYNNAVIFKNNGTAYTYTPDVTVPDGTQFLIQNTGNAGNIAIPATSGTLKWLRGNNNVPAGGARVVQPGGSALLTKVVGNTFHLVGTGIA